MGNPNPISGPEADLVSDLDPVVPPQQDDPDMAASKDEGAAFQKPPKKRTKTGCLTCRQRRIKCGEEKPVCNNCIKSKRECKGYTQRLVFKNPLGISGSMGTPLGAQMQPMPLTLPITSGYDAPAFSQHRPAGSHQPTLAPRPAAPPNLGHPSLSANIAPGYNGSSFVPFHYPPVQQQNPSIPESSVTTGPPPMPEFLLPQSQDFPPTNLDTKYAKNTVEAGFHSGPVQSNFDGNQETFCWDSSSDPSSFWQETTYEPMLAPDFPDITQPWEKTPSSVPARDIPIPTQEHPYQYSQTQIPPPMPSTRMEYFDGGDDYYDMESDEELEHQTSAQNFNQLSLIMASANRDERQLRSFTTYLNEPNILASYHPTLGSSPLNNPMTARIFLHFIHSTGPTLSIFERHPIDPSTMFGAPVTAAQQGIWTYTLPFKALEHQALMQTILALSSLQISYLQQVPTTVSLRHYHFALKRVGVAVGLPMRRQQIGTLAAALLLAYYEVMSAEHQKWNSHIAGSAQLIREIDFAGITRDLRAYRRRVRAQRQQRSSGWPFEDFYSFGNTAFEDDPFAEKESSIDESIIGALVGRAVNYDEFGQVEDGFERPRQKHFTRKDIENVRIQTDLYWWYCKQDIYQSIISGGALFMPYSHWDQCPPRAGMGRLDAIYGSADHLWLLLARLTDFGCRDRKRKLKAARATGFDWRPDSGLFKFMARFARGPPGGQNRPPQQPPSGPPGGPPGGPNGGPPPGPPRPGQRGGSPPMYGMVPSTGSRKMPPAFADTAVRNDLPSPSPGPDDDDEEGETYSDAEAEWESILLAFDTYAHALGPGYMPLQSDSAPPISSPFGPALQYRTHTVAVIWAFFYTGKTLLYRLHPSMPPAMMVAAGVAAPVTAELSQTIGKIAAGIYYPQIFNLKAGSLSPTLGSCLTEVTVPIFFAAVQITDAAQREWIVTKLRDVSRLAGWRSSDAIASGCEKAWEGAAKQGRGPPYRRTNVVPDENAPWIPNLTTANDERRFVTVNPAYSNWAMGILSLENDMDSLEIGNRQ